MVIKSSSVKSLAVFIDFENLALGFQGRNDRFEIKHVLTRLLEKGKIVAKKAYADWHRFSFYTSSLHEAAIELVEIPRRAQTGKNSADIRLCVDAMDLAYSKEHIDTFVIVSGDSDFSPLVSKLKELGKHVIGLGMTNSTSNLLRDNCDEFIYYEDLTQTSIPEVAIKSEMPDTKRKAFLLLAQAYNALRRDNREIIHSSTLKETMRRIKPSFNENYHGYRTFSLMLEDAQREGLLSLGRDSKSGTYVVTNMNTTFGEASSSAKSPQQQHGESQPANPSGSKEEHRDTQQNHRSHRRFQNSRRPPASSPRSPADQDRSGALVPSSELPQHAVRPLDVTSEVSRSAVEGDQDLHPPKSVSEDGARNHPELEHPQRETLTTDSDIKVTNPSQSEVTLQSENEKPATVKPIAAKPQRPWRSRSPRGSRAPRTPSPQGALENQKTSPAGVGGFDSQGQDSASGEVNPRIKDDDKAAN